MRAVVGRRVGVGFIGGMGRFRVPGLPAAAHCYRKAYHKADFAAVCVERVGRQSRHGYAAPPRVESECGFSVTWLATCLYFGTTGNREAGVNPYKAPKVNRGTADTEAA